MNRIRLRPLACALAAAGAAACQVAEAHVYNLGQVRDPDGSTRRVGAPMTAAEYLARTYLFTGLTVNQMELADKEPGPIEDPDRLALDNLIALAECDTSDPWIRAQQVDMCTWLAVDDDYTLARERAVLALLALGRDLEVPGPRNLAPDAPVATPDDLVGPLADLVRHVRPFLERREDPGAPLADTCRALSELVFDRQGARRVVLATGLLLERGGFAEPALEPLRTLHEEAARTAVALALGSALGDESEWVRAAALHVGTELTGGGMALARLRALESASEPVLVRVLAGLSRHGLPDPQEPLDEEQAWRYRAAWIVLLLDHAISPYGRVSIGACRALERVSGSGMASLRWEDWHLWWEEELRARGEAGEADNASP